MIAARSVVSAGSLVPDPFDFAAGLEVFGEVLAVLAESAEVDDSVDARSRRCLDEVLSAVPVPLLVARTPSIHRVDEVIGGVDGIAIDIERRSQGVRFKEVALNDVNARGR